MLNAKGATLLASVGLLTMAGVARSDPKSEFSVSKPSCMGAVCFVAVVNAEGTGVLIRAKSLRRTMGLAEETRAVLSRLAGPVVADACLPVPEICPAG